MKRSKKMTLALFIAVGVVGILLIIGSMNVGGDIVRREATTAVSEILGADLAIESVTGNPLKGYNLYEITLSKKGALLLSADSLGVKVNLMSVFSGSPRLSRVTIHGLDVDAEKLSKEFAAIKMKPGEGEAPIEALSIRNGRVHTPWGETTIAQTDFDLSKDGIKADVDLLMNTVPIKGGINLRREKEVLEFKDLNMKIGEGRIMAKGAILPSLSIKGEIEKLNVAQLALFWPTLRGSAYDGLFSSSFIAEGVWNNPILSGHLSFSGTSLAGYPVQSVESNWRYEAFRLNLEDLKGTALALPLSGRAAFAFVPGKAPFIDIALEGKNASLEELKKTVPALASAKGKVDIFSVVMKGSPTTLAGNIDLKAAQIEAYGQQLQNTSANVAFKGSTATIKGNSVIDGGSLALSGSVSQLQKNPRLDILFKARSIDVGKITASLPKAPKIVPKGAVSADVGIKGVVTAPRLEGRTWSDRLSYGEEAFNDLNVVFVFEKDVLTFSSARGRWRNIPMTGKGAIAGAGSPSPSLNLTVQAADVDPKNLEPFFPELKNYALRGNVTATARIEGKTTSPKIQLSAVSPRLGFMEQGHVADFSLQTDLALKEGIPKQVQLDVKAGSLGFAGVGAEKIAARIEASKESISLSTLTARLGSGEISGSGSVKLQPKAPADLDLTFEIKEGDLAVLARAGRLPYSLSGTLSGKTAVKGKADNPSISAEFSSPRTVFSGFAFTNLNGAVEGNMGKMSLKNFNASVGGGTVSAQGTFNLKKDVPEATLSLSGKGLDVAALTSGVKEMAAYKPSGTINVDFDGTFSGVSSEGKGSLSAPSLSLAGLKLSNISYPFTLRGMNVIFANAHAELYGGTASGKGEIDLAKGTFTKSVHMENVNVDPLLQDATGGLEGHINGKAKGDVSLSGRMAKGLSFNGKGEVHIGEGSISDFKAVKLGASLYGQSAIRFASVVAPFRVETRRIILDNAKATAFQNDPIYRFLKASGPVGFDTTLALQCQGNANIQVLNALFGGVAGILGAGGTSSLEGILKGALTGAKAGLEKSDFRDISFNVGGTIGKPSVSNVKIAPAPQTVDKTTPQGTQPSAVEEQIAPPKDSTGETEKKPENLLEEAIQEGLKNILKK